MLEDGNLWDGFPSDMTKIIGRINAKNRRHSIPVSFQRHELKPVFIYSSDINLR
jgi:hypothetical protein